MATASKIPSLDVTKSQKGFQVSFEPPRYCSCLGRPCRLDAGTCFADSARGVSPADMLQRYVKAESSQHRLISHGMAVA